MNYVHRGASGGILIAALATLVACGGGGSNPGAGGSGGSGGTGGTGGMATGGSAGMGGGGGDMPDAGPDASTGGGTPGGTVEVLAGAVGEAGHVNGPKGTSRLRDVGGMVYIAPTLHVADRHAAIRKIDVNTGVTTTAPNDDGLDAEFFQPIALATGGGNSLYVLQGLKTMMNGVVGQVSRYNVGSGVIEAEITLDSYQELPYDLFDPVPFAVEPSGNVLVGEKARVSPSTLMVSNIGIREVWGTSASLTAWVPANGTMYTVHRAPSFVLESDLAAKTWKLVAGTDMNQAEPAVDGPKETARFSNRVGGASHDGNGHLYVADTNANAVRKVDLATGAITTVIGELSPVGSIVTGDLKTARLHHPQWVTWLGDGKLAIGCPEDFVVLIATGL
ncbi:hypothetical protein [Polyangium sp. 15x6]|uniref:hypothetical protein n=1 Tax=Polyangium sp. 15x6 TaxID=3042687 RepID=UPI00249A74DA|nr:hypothetical protein [Polyangium sp. 15x6]MDI3287795.1 hypothetical protein [Polyangium sp. 15x6]